jgi:aminomuconate-semialdehyde/2-hydroxymuconate-6-semialdehyde dehydrogenase
MNKYIQTIIDNITIRKETVQLSNFMFGKHIGPANKEYIDGFNPATGKKQIEIPRSTEKDLEGAVMCAQMAITEWSQTSNEFRHDVLMKISDLILENLELFAMAESLDSGKTLHAAMTIDIPRAAANFKFFATAIMNFASESHEMQGEAINYTLRQPVGIVGCISPWNLPLYLFTWKIAPALAAGNCVIAKPSEITPLTAHLLSLICIEAGLPRGVLCIIHGQGHEIGEAIVKHPKIKAISFTGGTNTGASIARVAAPMFKKLSLELGGKNPNIIFDDCNYEEALNTSIRSSFNNQGQICLCGSRIFVQRALYQRFKYDFIDKILKIKVGNPLDDKSDLGAVVSEAHAEKVMSYIDLAKAEGGKILCGGERLQLDAPCENGYFIAPTVIEGLDYKCRTNQEEIFGPVVTITPFDTEEDVLDMANSVQFGLAASVWTENIGRANRMATQLQCGIVWINCWMLRDLRIPFGGTKASGVGREGGWEALRFFTEAKNVTVKY